MVTRAKRRNGKDDDQIQKQGEIVRLIKTNKISDELKDNAMPEANRRLANYILELRGVVEGGNPRISQHRLAQNIGIPLPSLRNYEKGETNPELIEGNTVRRLAKAGGLTEPEFRAMMRGEEYIPEVSRENVLAYLRHCDQEAILEMMMVISQRMFDIHVQTGGSVANILDGIRFNRFAAEAYYSGVPDQLSGVNPLLLSEGETLETEVVEDSEEKVSPEDEPDIQEDEEEEEIGIAAGNYELAVRLNHRRSTFPTADSFFEFAADCGVPPGAIEAIALGEPVSVELLGFLSTVLGIKTIDEMVDIRDQSGRVSLEQMEEIRTELLEGMPLKKAS